MALPLSLPTCSFGRFRLQRVQPLLLVLLLILVAALPCRAGDPVAPAPAPVAKPGPGPGAGGRILIIGDSLAAGHGLESTEAFPALVQEKIQAEGWSFVVVNGGLSGDTTAGGLRRIDWLLRGGADILIVELGGNDGLRGIAPAETRANLQGIIDHARKKNPAVEVIVAGMQMPPNMGEDYTAAFRKIFPELAKTNNAALIPFLLEGVGGHPELNQDDRIHPTAEGHKLVAATVWAVLRPILQKRVEAATSAPAPSVPAPAKG